MASFRFNRKSNSECKLLSFGHLLISQIAFLLEKCGELIPAQTQSIVISDMESSTPQMRSVAMRRLATLFAWRFQILAQNTLSDRRGPIFHFVAPTLDFVSTEIGSPVWVAAQDRKDTALQKFGTTLPLELRQRLMELGWNEESATSDEVEYEQVPVTSLQTSQYMGDLVGSVERSSSPMRGLLRRASSASGGSLGTKRRRAIFAPAFASVVAEHADQLGTSKDSLMATTSDALTRYLQRDDPAGLLRSILLGFTTDVRVSLAQLNALMSTITPSFAYMAFNAVTGHLKTVLRSSDPPSYYAVALATVARLIPAVSGVSLRDIRKNKAETVLLPASIHEEDGGFKVHPPWQNDDFEVQTAQLLVLTELLKAHPRDVYLVKKMLSNLQIQTSINIVSFARAWLGLNVHVFGIVNWNYNDRAELRHFLANTAAVMRAHHLDVSVVSLAMRLCMLCSARYRRLFANMGFATVLPAMIAVYATGHSSIRDSIVYACRSFYRIHQETFVYQTCMAVADGQHDAQAVYEVLGSLSSASRTFDGTSSGLKGLNDAEELDAFVRMVSGPEMTFSEIGSAATERQASKLASLSAKDQLFPRENVVRLFFTIIAANPATPRAVNLISLFARIIPHIKDAPSNDLIREGVEALGGIVGKSKTGDVTPTNTLNASDNAAPDWIAAKSAYVFLVESFARHEGSLSPIATKRVLDFVLELLRHQPHVVGPAAASIIRELGKNHLSAANAGTFLRDIAPIYRAFIRVVDFSGFLDAITSMLTQPNASVNADTIEIIAESYLQPTLQILAGTTDAPAGAVSMLSGSVVDLLSAGVLMPGDCLAALEGCSPGPDLLASVVLPFVLRLRPRLEGDPASLDGVWLRLLNYTIRTSRNVIARAPTRQSAAAVAVLSLQIVKVIIIRAAIPLSSTRGLWAYIADHLIQRVEGANGRFSDALPPRIVDWMMWSLYEMLSLHSSPIAIHLRYHMHLATTAVSQEIRSNPSTPGDRSVEYPSLGRSRFASARSPSIALHGRLPNQGVLTPSGTSHSRMPSAASIRLSPDPGTSHSLIESAEYPHFIGHARKPSASRPSFADLSARRASRPVFEAFPGSGNVRFRFPSAAPIPTRSGEKGAAIVHLLGASQALSAPTMPTRASTPSRGADSFTASIRLSHSDLITATRTAMRRVQAVMGYHVELDEHEDVQQWSANDALVSGGPLDCKSNQSGCHHTADPAFHGI